MRPGHVCPKCWRDSPCPVHSRPPNARWSKNRDGAAQHRFRAAVLARDGKRCIRCGETKGLVAHHVREGYDATAGITLCGDCHKEVDRYAR